MLVPCLPTARAARTVLGLLSLVLLTSPGRAADVTYNGSIGTSVTHSDNLDQDPKGQESSGLVFTQDVGLAMRAVGARSDVAVNGTVKLDTTVGDQKEVNLRPEVVALGQTELANGFLLLSGGMSWRREPLTPDAALSATTDLNSNDTTQVFNLNFNPTLRSRLGDYAKGELRYRYARNFIASDAVRETEINQQVAVLQSDRPLYPYRLTLTGEHTTADKLGGDKLGSNGDLEQLSGSLRTEYAFSPRMALIGIAGYDDISGGAVDPDLGGAFGAVGLRYEPNSGTELEGTVGYRFGRPNVQALLRQRITGRIQAVVSYSTFLELPLDAGSGADLTIDPETGQIVHAITRLPLSVNFPGLGLKDSASLTDRLDAALTGTFDRTTATLGVRWERRDFATDPDERLAAILLRLQRQLTSRLTLSLDSDFRRTETAGDREPALSVLIRTGLNYEIGPSLYGYAAYARSQGFSGSREDKYVENAVMIGLRLTF